MSVIALIPAKQRSTGCPGKNFRELGRQPLWKWAVDCAFNSGHEIGWRTRSEPPEWRNLVVTSDAPSPIVGGMTWLHRPSELAQDDTPMIDVVKHALSEIPGPPDQIIVLLQPTQPFRTPAHVKAAIELLQTSGADSVVSVVELPKTHNAGVQCWIRPDGRLDTVLGLRSWDGLPGRRQEMPTHYIRDGTVYCFTRSTVERHGTIYGRNVLPLIIPPDETCELDTIEQWNDVERRWKERHVQQP